MVEDADFAWLEFKLADSYWSVGNNNAALWYMNQSALIFSAINERKYRACLSRLLKMNTSMGAEFLDTGMFSRAEQYYSRGLLVGKKMLFFFPTSIFVLHEYAKVCVVASVLQYLTYNDNGIEYYSIASEIWQGLVKRTGNRSYIDALEILNKIVQTGDNLIESICELTKVK